MIKEGFLFPNLDFFGYPDEKFEFSFYLHKTAENTK